MSFLRRAPGDGTHAPMAKAAGKRRPLVEDSMAISAYQNVRFWHLADISDGRAHVRFWSKADIADARSDVRFGSIVLQKSGFGLALPGRGSFSSLPRALSCRALRSERRL